MPSNNIIVSLHTTMKLADETSNFLCLVVSMLIELNMVYRFLNLMILCVALVCMFPPVLKVLKLCFDRWIFISKGNLTYLFVFIPKKLYLLMLRQIFSYLLIRLIKSN